MKKLSAIIAMLFIVAIAFTQSFVVNDIAYNVTSNVDPFEVEVGIKTPRCVGDIVIPEQVTYKDTTYTVTAIGYRAFLSSFSLTSVSIPNTVISIAWEAFMSCIGISNLIIPNSVVFVDSRAFASCTSLTSLSFPASMDSIGTCAFWECTALNTITCPTENQKYTVIDNVLYNKDVTTLVKYPSARIADSYVFPSTVTRIEPYAFNYCNSLSSLTIPDHVLGALHEHTFSYTANLENIFIGNGISVLGNSAFVESADLKQVYFGESVEILNLKSFTLNPKLIEFDVSENNPYFATYDGVLYNKNLTTLIKCPEAKPQVSFPLSINTIAIFAFEYCIYLTSLEMPNTITEIGKSAFKSCIGLTNVSISNSLIELSSSAFTNCSSIKSIIIPSSIRKINNGAFYSCDSLKSITLSINLDTIQNGAFKECSSLQNIIIPNNVKFIGESAFSNCNLLDTVNIGYSINSIGKLAFENCTQLSTLKCCATQLPVLGNTVFKNVPLSLKIYVPVVSVTDYSQSNQWSDFSVYGTEDCTSDVQTIDIVDKYEIFPNPTTDFIILSKIDDGNNAIFQVYNLNSEIVLSIDFSKYTEISLEHLDKGIYFYRIKSKNKIFSGKIVKL